jgi:hypothetical protein
MLVRRYIQSAVGKRVGRAVRKHRDPLLAPEGGLPKRYHLLSRPGSICLTSIAPDPKDPIVIVDLIRTVGDGGERGGNLGGTHWTSNVIGRVRSLLCA